MTRLDVVIVNWNAGRQLLECLQSLQTAAQSPDFELAACVVVDNASADDSLAGLGDMDLPLVVVENPENRGLATAWNQGANLGAGEYVLFLNPDIRLYEDSLSKALGFMEMAANSEVGVLGIQLIGQDGKVQRNVARFPTPKSLFTQMLGLDRLWPGRFPSHFLTGWDHQESRVVDQVPGAFFLVRREVFDALGGFDQRFFMYFEDLDFAYRLRQAGWRSYYLSGARTYHLGGGTTGQIAGRRLFYVLRSRVQYVDKHFGLPAALGVLTASFGVEAPVRLGWSLLRRSGRKFLDTLKAYGLLAVEVPRLLRVLW